MNKGTPLRSVSHNSLFMKAPCLVCFDVSFKITDRKPLYSSEECDDMYEHVILLRSCINTGFEREASSENEFKFQCSE